MNRLQAGRRCLSAAVARLGNLPALKQTDMANTRKMVFSKEWKIGLVSVVIILLFVWVGFFLAGRNLLSKENTFYAVFENTGGINVSGPVVINGKKVGRISRIEFVSATDHRIKVELAVQKKYPLNEGTVASVESFGLMTGSGIVLYLGDSPEMMKSGSFMQARSEPDLMDRLAPLEKKISSILSSVDSILSGIDPASVSGSMKNIEAVSGRIDRLIEGNSRRVDAIMANMEELSRALQENKEGLSRMIGNFSAVSDTIAQAGIGALMRDLASTLGRTQALLSGLNAGQGSMGKLLVEDSLYRNLEKSSRQLNLLLQDLRVNPERYVHISVFGRKEKKSEKPPLE